MKHNEDCPKSGKWYQRKECREFSTDGTALGADIAHTMGTADEKEIKQRGADDFSDEKHLTGMDAEQADWDSEE